MTLVLFLSICIASIATCSWINTQSTLTRGDRYMGAAVYNNETIYIIGGDYNGHQILEFNVNDQQFVDDGTNAFKSTNAPFIDDGIYGVSQFYTQQQNIFYIIDPNAARCNYDFCGQFGVLYLDTKQYYTPWKGIKIPKSPDCLTSTPQYLILVGGTWDSNNIFDNESYGNFVQMLSLEDYNWVKDVAQLNERRKGTSCVVHTSNHSNTQNIYAIGGDPSDDDTYLPGMKSIEMNVIDNGLHKAWIYIDNLTVGACYARAIAVEEYIFVIGGTMSQCRYWDQRVYSNSTTSDVVQIIDTKSNTVRVATDKLLYQVTGTAAIYMDHVLYLFGGGTPGDVDRKWMYYHVTNILTDAPIISPTLETTTLLTTADNGSDTMDDAKTTTLMLIVLGAIGVCLLLTAIAFSSRNTSRNVAYRQMLLDSDESEMVRTNTDYTEYYMNKHMSSGST